MLIKILSCLKWGVVWKAFVQVCIQIRERIWACKQEILICKMEGQTQLDTYRNNHYLLFVYRTIIVLIERLHFGRAAWKLLQRASDILPHERFSLLGVFCLVAVSPFFSGSCAKVIFRYTLLQHSSVLLYMQQRELLPQWENEQKVNVSCIVVELEKVRKQGSKLI